MRKLIETIIGKKKDVRKVIVEKTIGDVDNIESITIEEFNFIKACVELSKLNDELLDQVGKQIEEMEDTIENMRKELRDLNKRLEKGE